MNTTNEFIYFPDYIRNRLGIWRVLSLENDVLEMQIHRGEYGNKTEIRKFYRVKDCN